MILKYICEKAGKQKAMQIFSGIQATVMEMEFMWAWIKSECEDWSFNIKLTYDPKLYGAFWYSETVLASKVFF